MWNIGMSPPLADILQSCLRMRARTWPLVALLVLVPLVSWAWIVVLSHDMYGPMTGASAWMMTAVWDAPHVLLLWTMWAVMMTGMMLPSAAPMIVLAGGSSGYFVAVGYVSVWAAFSAGATALQLLLSRLLIVTPMMELSNRRVGAVLLACAGLYQLTPLKRACLTTCQSPMAFLTRRWRAGSFGAFRMGAEHGVYCVGCCWALMLLLFAGGVMNLTVIAALTVFVAFEKLAPVGAWGARISGALLILLAARIGLR
jgi:predicted metal-binding membrane protein